MRHHLCVLYLVVVSAVTLTAINPARGAFLPPEELSKRRALLDRDEDHHACHPFFLDEDTPEAATPDSPKSRADTVAFSPMSPILSLRLGVCQPTVVGPRCQLEHMNSPFADTYYQHVQGFLQTRCLDFDLEKCCHTLLNRWLDWAYWKLDEHLGQGRLRPMVCYTSPVQYRPGTLDGHIHKFRELQRSTHQHDRALTALFVYIERYLDTLHRYSFKDRERATYQQLYAKLAGVPYTATYIDTPYAELIANIVNDGYSAAFIMAKVYAALEGDDTGDDTTQDATLDLKRAHTL